MINTLLNIAIQIDNLKCSSIKAEDLGIHKKHLIRNRGLDLETENTGGIEIQKTLGKQIEIIKMIITAV